ncbi:pentapeptide repeat-containing protein [Kribbella yunnanensis]|uniref:pentapeptide repeat-containing protein n=1 Tax=Kribbella yunnanensis TaxID=190194 RepID=UPI0031DE8BDD
MEIREVREARSLMPVIDEMDLTEVDALTGAAIREAAVGGIDATRLRLEDVTIVGSRFVGTRLADALWEGVVMSGSVFDGVDLSSARVDGGKLDRVHFRGCQLSGLSLSGVACENVIFGDCRLDYATFDTVRTAGALGFVNCSMSETSLVGCRWDKAVIDGCRLSGLELDHCDLRGSDLRGNSLATVRGVGSLRGVTLTADQLADLTAALVADLEIRIARP